MYGKSGDADAYSYHCRKKMVLIGRVLIVRGLIKAIILRYTANKQMVIRLTWCQIYRERKSYRSVPYLGGAFEPCGVPVAIRRSVSPITLV